MRKKTRKLKNQGTLKVPGNVTTRKLQLDREKQRKADRDAIGTVADVTDGTRAANEAMRETIYGPDAMAEAVNDTREIHPDGTVETPIMRPSKDEVYTQTKANERTKDEYFKEQRDYESKGGSSLKKTDAERENEEAAKLTEAYDAAEKENQSYLSRKEDDYFEFMPTLNVVDSIYRAVKPINKYKIAKRSRAFLEQRRKNYDDLATATYEDAIRKLTEDFGDTEDWKSLLPNPVHYMKVSTGEMDTEKFLEDIANKYVELNKAQIAKRHRVKLQDIASEVASMGIPKLDYMGRPVLDENDKQITAPIKYRDEFIREVAKLINPKMADDPNADEKPVSFFLTDDDMELLETWAKNFGFATRPGSGYGSGSGSRSGSGMKDSELTKEYRQSVKDKNANLKEIGQIDQDIQEALNYGNVSPSDQLKIKGYVSVMTNPISTQADINKAMAELAALKTNSATQQVINQLSTRLKSLKQANYSLAQNMLDAFKRSHPGEPIAGQFKTFIDDTFVPVVDPSVAQSINSLWSRTFNENAPGVKVTTGGAGQNETVFSGGINDLLMYEILSVAEQRASELKGGTPSNEDVRDVYNFILSQGAKRKGITGSLDPSMGQEDYNMISDVVYDTNYKPEIQPYNTQAPSQWDLQLTGKTQFNDIPSVQSRFEGFDDATKKQAENAVSTAISSGLYDQYEPLAQAAAAAYGLDPTLLMSFGIRETNLNPKATNTNTNGSTDYGMFQINLPDRATNQSKYDALVNAWIKEGLIDPGKDVVDQLMDPATNAKIAAYTLNQKIQGGNKSWEDAIANYNGSLTGSAQDRVKDYQAKLLFTLHQLRSAGK